jgi:hypothetical protein
VVMYFHVVFYLINCLAFLLISVCFYFRIVVLIKAIFG